MTFYRLAGCGIWETNFNTCEKRLAKYHFSHYICKRFYRLSKKVYFGLHSQTQHNITNYYTHTENKKEMKTTLWNLFFLTVVTALSTYNVRSQVTIGGLADPKAGIILDLNSDTKGGLLLPNIDIPDLSKIPATGFLGINAEQDINLNLAGTLVYNTNTTTGPGVFLWCGHDWNRIGKSGALIILEDPGNTSPFPFDGSQANSYTVDNHTCSQAGQFTFTWIAGEKYIDQLSILDSGAGTFILKFLPNDRAVPRHAVLLVSDACGNNNTFIFAQEGDMTGCGASPLIPDPHPGNTLTLCVGGSVYLHLDGHTDAGAYIWTLNGQEVGRGHEYIATQPGRYIVYADKIGCSNSKEVVVTASNTISPAPPQLIVNTNNGVVCDPSGTTDLVVLVPPGSNVAWYQHSIRQDPNVYHGNTIKAGVGVWHAVVEEGDCSSLPSDKAYVYVDNSGSAIPTPIIKVNGQTGGNLRLCQSGSAYLEVDNYSTDYTYTWYADNTQIGKGTGIYYQVSSVMPSVILRVRATGIGCASEANANLTIETNSTPAIPVIVGRSILCGGNTTLSVNTSVASPTVTWYKDGVVLNKTGISLLVTEPGNYSATVTDNGCVSPMSVVRPVTLSDFTRLSWIKEPTNGFFGDQRTFEASGTNGPLTYTWTITRGDGSNEDITSSVIKSGQGTSQVLVEYPQQSGSNNTEDFIISVRGVNACGADVTAPPLAKTITVKNQCLYPQITYPVGNQNMDLLLGNTVVLSVAATDLNEATYQWYKGTGTSNMLAGETAAALVYTPAQTGTEIFWCRVSNGCGVNYFADSPEFKITTNQNPENMAVGSGNLKGKTCFDIAESNFGGLCGTSDSRLSNKANFAVMSVQDKTYTFTANSIGDNFHFVVVDPEQVLDENTPYTVTNNLAGSFVSGNTATIVLNFKTNLNSTDADPLIVGRTSDQAAKIKLYAVWKTSSVDYSVLLTIRIQDCLCCGAMISPTEWRAFMCHNLGADQSLPPFTPAKGLNGSYYKFGGPDKPFDSYNRLLSPVADVNWNTTLIPPNFNNPSLYPTTNWNDNVKTANDPCPPGYRVPTKAQWQGVLDNNVFTPTASTWSSNATNFTTGMYVGSSLYLPASGYYHGNGAVFYNRGLEGCYWSSTFSRNTLGATGTPDTDLVYYMDFTKTTKGMLDLFKSMAFPIRCIAE